MLCQSIKNPALVAGLLSGHICWFTYWTKALLVFSTVTPIFWPRLSNLGLSEVFELDDIRPIGRVKSRISPAVEFHRLLRSSGRQYYVDILAMPYGTRFESSKKGGTE